MDVKAILKDKFKLAVLIVGVLGILAVMSFSGELLRETSTVSAEQRQFAAMTGQAVMVLELEKLERGATMLRLGGLIALVGLALVVFGKMAIGGWVLVGSGVLPALFHVNVLMVSFLLIIAGGIALFANKQRAGSLTTA